MYVYHRVHACERTAAGGVDEAVEGGGHAERRGGADGLGEGALQEGEQQLFRLVGGGGFGCLLYIFIFLSPLLMGLDMLRVHVYMVRITQPTTFPKPTNQPIRLSLVSKYLGEGLGMLRESPAQHAGVAVLVLGGRAWRMVMVVVDGRFLVGTYETKPLTAKTVCMCVYPQ